VDVGGLDGRGGLGTLRGVADGGARAQGRGGVLHARGAAVPAAGPALPRPARAHRYRPSHRASRVRPGGRPLLRDRRLPARLGRRRQRDAGEEVVLRQRAPRDLPLLEVAHAGHHVPPGQAADPGPARARGAGGPGTRRPEALPRPVHAAGHNPARVLRGRAARADEGPLGLRRPARDRGLTAPTRPDSLNFAVPARPSEVPLGGPTMTLKTLEDTPTAVPNPPTARKLPKIDVVHGERRQDDYFWLREKSNPEVAAYLEAENAYTDAVMKPTVAFQGALYDEMLARIQ